MAAATDLQDSARAAASAVKWMVSKPKVTLQKEEMLEKEGPEIRTEEPPARPVEWSVKALIRVRRAWRR